MTTNHHTAIAVGAAANAATINAPLEQLDSVIPSAGVPGIALANTFTAGQTIDSGNGDQLDLDNAGEQFTQIDFLNNGAARCFISFDQTNDVFVIGAQTGYATFDRIIFRPDGSNDDFVIERDGNVGIGLASPSYRFQVSGSDTTTLTASGTVISCVTITNTDTTVGNYSTLYFNNGSALDASIEGVHTRGANNEGYLRFQTRNSAGTYATRMTIDSAGNLGIGTETPGSLLELNLSTEDLEIVDAGSAGATEQDWIQVQVGGVIGYIRVFATT